MNVKSATPTVSTDITPTVRLITQLSRIRKIVLAIFAASFIIFAHLIYRDLTLYQEPNRLAFLALAYAGVLWVWVWRANAVFPSSFIISWVVLVPIACAALIGIIEAIVNDQIDPFGHDTPGFFLAISIILGYLWMLVSVPWRIRRRLLSSRVRYWGVLKKISRSDSSRQLPISRFRHAARPVRSVLYLLAACMCLYTISFMVIDEWGQSIDPIQLIHSVSIYLMISAGLLHRSRKAAQIPADVLLDFDQRAPVIYLRSFSDDHARARRVFPGFYLFLKILFYYVRWRGIDEVLSRCFRRVGPFVGIADPSTTLPAYGAAKVRHDNNNWQDVVREWIIGSCCIVLVSGRTHWVKWEIQTIIDAGAADKLVVIFPAEGRRARQKRMDWLFEYFSATDYGEALKATDLRRAIALTFPAPGSVNVINCKFRSSHAYGVAANIALYELLMRR